MPVDLGLALTTLKAIAVVAKRAGDVTLYDQIINLQQTVLELVSDRSGDAEEISRLRQGVVTLREKVVELEQALGLRDEMTFRGEAYWRVRHGQEDEGPLCPRCYDGQDRLARMRDRGNGYTCCVVCDYCFGEARRRGPVNI